MFKKLAIRVGLALLGMVITLTWWTYHGHDTSTESQDQIPTSVWGGGPAKITVEVETTTPATMRIDFNEHDKEPGQQKMLQTWEKISAGTKTWTVEAPAKVGGYIELGADHPKVGDKLKWRVTINGQQVGQEEWTLEKELEKGTAMFLQLYFDDYSKAPQELEGQQ
jgi:hypothetical protein